MPETIETLLRRNLHGIFGERDGGIATIYFAFLAGAILPPARLPLPRT